MCMRPAGTLLAVMCVVLSGTALLAAGSVEARTSGTPTLASNEAAAQADAAALQSEVALPTGAQQLSGEPSGDNGLLKPLPHLIPTAIGVVDNSWWQVAGATPSQVIATVSASPPPGAGPIGTSSTNGPGGSARGVGFMLKDVPDVLDYRMVQVSATVLSSGDTGVLVQTQSLWVVPRSAASLVPATVRVISVSETIGDGKVLHSSTVTAASRIHAALAYFNGLEADQPIASSCPTEPPEGDDDVVTVKFLRSHGTAPLATASFNSVLGQRGSGTASICNPVLLRVGAKTRVSLIGDNYIPALNRLLGTHIP